jgi:hypothetical protein
MIDFVTAIYPILTDWGAIHYIDCVKNFDYASVSHWLCIVASLLGLSAWRIIWRWQRLSPSSQSEETRDDIVRSLTLGALTPHPSHGQITDLVYVKPLPSRFSIFTNRRLHGSLPNTHNSV